MKKKTSSQANSAQVILAKAAASPLPLAPKGKTALAVVVVGGKPGATVEIQPGKTYLPLPAADVNTIGLAEWVPTGDGSWKPVVKQCPRFFKITRLDLKKLNIPISEMTMRRLVTAGFVDGQALTPFVVQFDFFSYLEHVRRVKEDTEFWDRKEPGQKFTNRKRYRDAL